MSLITTEEAIEHIQSILKKAADECLAYLIANLDLVDEEQAAYFLMGVMNAMKEDKKWIVIV